MGKPTNVVPRGQQIVTNRGDVTVPWQRHFDLAADQNERVRQAIDNASTLASGASAAAVVAEWNAFIERLKGTN